MDFPPKSSLNILSGSIKVGIVQAVTDYHEINVAMSRIGSLCHRAEHEGALDYVSIWLKGLLDWLSQADRFLNEPPQLFKDWGRLVCPIVLLISDTFNRHQAASL